MSKKIVAQGELTIINLGLLSKAELRELGLTSADVPKDARLSQRGGRLIVGHSETGHHHVIESPCAELFETADPLVCFLRLEAPTQLTHLREHHTHGPQSLPASTYRVTRQRERGPAGWQRTLD